MGENSKLEENVEDSLSKLESLKTYPSDMHKFQSAQRLGGIFLTRKDYSNTLRVCTLLDTWMTNLPCSNDLSKSSMLKIELWTLLTELQCLLLIKSDKPNPLTIAQRLLDLLCKSRPPVVDQATFSPTLVKFRALLWQTKTAPLSVQLVTFSLLNSFPLRRTRISTPCLPSTFPFFSKSFV